MQSCDAPPVALPDLAWVLRTMTMECTAKVLEKCAQMYSRPVEMRYHRDPGAGPIYPMHALSACRCVPILTWQRDAVTLSKLHGAGSAPMAQIIQAAAVDGSGSTGCVLMPSQDYSTGGKTTAGIVRQHLRAEPEKGLRQVADA